MNFASTVEPLWGVDMSYTLLNLGIKIVMVILNSSEVYEGRRSLIISQKVIIGNLEVLYTFYISWSCEENIFRTVILI